MTLAIILLCAALFIMTLMWAEERHTNKELNKEYLILMSEKNKWNKWPAAYWDLKRENIQLLKLLPRYNKPDFHETCDDFPERFKDES